MKFALLKDGAFVEVRELKRQPENIPAKGVVWLPFEVEDPAYDHLTQVRTGPETVIEASRVVKRWTVRNKTAEELAAEASSAKDNDLEYSRVALMVGFDHENRIRTLEGRPQITAAQYRAAVKARL